MPILCCDLPPLAQTLIKSAAEKSCLGVVVLWKRRERKTVWDEAMKKAQHSQEETNTLILARIWSERTTGMHTSGNL